MTAGPFTVEQARRAGLERWHLDTAAWKRIGPKTYAAADVQLSPLQRIEAAARRLPAGAAFSGTTAAWLHGLDLNPCDPIEVTAPPSVGIATRSGMAVCRADLDPGEITRLRGLPVTSIARTVCDVCMRLPIVEAVVVCDMALHQNLLTAGSLMKDASRRAGARGIVTLRAALRHAEPASESPMETRLRMLLVQAGLPRPEAQVTIRDRWLRHIARVDLFYREQRLAIEYDGATHNESLAADNRRQNRLLEAEVRLLRFTSGDVYITPEVVVSQVTKALAAWVR